MTDASQQPQPDPTPAPAPSPAPSAGPSAGPSPDPSAGPSPEPIPDPSAAPSPEPSPAGAGGPYPWGLFQPVVPARPRRPLRAALAAAVTVLVVVGLGGPLGLIWAVLAPSVPVRMGDEGVVLVDAQPEEFIAADGWFSLLGMGFGVLAAVAVWLLARRWRGPLSLLAVTLGAVGAGLLAWWVGRQVGAGEYQRLLDSAPAGTVFGKPADLRAADIDLLFGFLPVAVRGDVLVPALAAAIAYTLLAGWSRYSSLRPDPETGGLDGYAPLPYGQLPHPPGGQWAGGQWAGGQWAGEQRSSGQWTGAAGGPPSTPRA